MADEQVRDGELEKGQRSAYDLQRLLSNCFSYNSMTDAFG